MEAGYEGIYENRLLRKDRSTIVVESQARHFAYRGRNVRVTVVRNITERKRADEALRSEERLALAMKATQDACMGLGFDCQHTLLLFSLVEDDRL